MHHQPKKISQTLHKKLKKLKQQRLKENNRYEVEKRIDQ